MVEKLSVSAEEDSLSFLAVEADGKIWPGGHEDISPSQPSSSGQAVPPLLFLERFSALPPCLTYFYVNT